MRYLLLLLLLGCSSEKKLFKAEARLAQAGRLPAICAERYPTIPDTTYLKDSVIVLDTLLSTEYVSDTVRLNDTLYYAKYKPITILKEVTKTKIERVVDKAKEKELEARVKLLEAQNSTISEDLKDYTKKAKTRLYWLIFLAVAIAAKILQKPIKRIIEWNSLRIPKL